jgi:hypothetical protein
MLVSISNEFFYRCSMNFLPGKEKLVVYLQMVQNLMIERKFAVNNKLEIATYLS